MSVEAELYYDKLKNLQDSFKYVKRTMMLSLKPDKHK